ncbi:MAG: tol-pal system protein YbgF [Ahrensia sp.]|nr:tol-pal system protein YbgF [Ahrensia sp.]
MARKWPSLGGAQNPEELYQVGYSHILNGDYALAEGVFARFGEIYPNDPLSADARFWLGESLLAQGRFEDAADVFIETRSLYPNARKAPETLLKIGTIMAALGNREVACVTFEDALKNQTQMSGALRNRIGQEHTNAKC